ncbi:MAG: hypothetical protein MAG795_00626 [Candidatus Woesearchaeota archaeon]|nr:hypothetical protein [Candidatus Woesearchaeota archaeon]
MYAMSEWGENPQLEIKKIQKAENNQNIKPKKQNKPAKPRKYLLIILIAVITIFLLVGAYLLLSKSGKIDQVTHSYIKPTNQITQTKSYCQKLNSQILADRCWLNLAVRDKNKKLCSKTSTYEQVCQNIIDKNKDSCENADSKILNDCYYSLAFILNDMDICKKGVIKSSIQFPRPISLFPDSITECKIAVAVKTGNPKYCEKVASTSREHCIKQLAYEYLDQSYCNLLQDQDLQFCIKQVSAKKAAQSNNPEQCKAISDSVFRKKCFEYLVENKQDYKVCLQSDSPSECILNTATKLLNQEACEDKVLNSDQKQRCLQNIAIKTKDTLLCNELVDSEDCFFQIAMQYLDSKTCQLLTQKDRCYYELAKLKKDRSLCNNIQDADTKTDCENILDQGVVALLPDACSIAGFKCKEWEIKDDKILLKIGLLTQDSVSDMELTLFSKCNPKSASIAKDSELTFTCDMPSKTGTQRQDIAITYTQDGEDKQTIGYVKFTS